MYSTGDTSSGGSYVTTSHHGLFLGCAATSAFMNQSFSQFRLTTTDSTVKLYSGGNTKLQTSSTGVSITGIPVATQTTGNIGLELHATGSGRGSQTKYHNDHGEAYVGTAGDTTGNFLVHN